MARIDNFSEEELRAIVESSKSNSEILLKLGYGVSGASGKTLCDRCEKYGITLPVSTATTRGELITTDDLCEDSRRNTCSIKRFIIRNKIIPYQCSQCANTGLWNNKTLVLQLDHINGINNDHRIENLRFLCPNCHSQTSTYSTNSRTKPAIATLSLCCECGAVVSKNSSLCRECASKYQRLVDRPSRDALKLDIREKTLVEIGRSHGVSDNAIRKWCKSYNLPFLKREINKYSDDEWEKI